MQVQGKEMPFDEDTAVTCISPGQYTCDISPNHWIVAGPNGGYLAALLTQAGGAHLDDPSRQLRSLTVHYLRPPKQGPAKIEVVVEQLGRSVAYLRLKMTQNAKPILLATGAWGGEREGIELTTWSLPKAAPLDECDKIGLVRKGPSLAIHKEWDIRNASNISFGGEGPMDMTWWIRPATHRPLDGAMIVAMADALPPPIFATTSVPMAVPTVDLTVHIRAMLAKATWNPGDWILTRFTTRHASGGYLEEDGELWTADGTLLAHSRQLALCT